MRGHRRPFCHTPEVDARRGPSMKSLCILLLLTIAMVPARSMAGAEVDTEIVGIDDKEIVKNIEATLSIIRDKKRDDLDDAVINQMHERAPSEIKKAVEPFG